MGDRISISFVNNDEESVTLFSHWDGKDLLNGVKKYLDVLNNLDKKDKISDPLSRREPNTLMIDFIRFYLKDEPLHIEGNYYLGKTMDDGDNSDNGHWTINVITGEFI